KTAARMFFLRIRRRRPGDRHADTIPLEQVPVLATVPGMADLGFWRLAENDRERSALIGPDGTIRKAGELLDRANALANGFGDLGLEPGDTVAVLMRNSIDMI